MSHIALEPADPQLVKLAQDNLIAYFRAFAGIDGVHFIEGPTATWVATDNGPPGNQILRCRFGVAADQEIETLVRQIGRHADSFDWFVFPACQPDDLKERVEAYGRAGGPDGRWQLHGTVGGLSIGFWDRGSETLEGGGRLLKEIELVEVSVVLRRSLAGNRLVVLRRS